MKILRGLLLVCLIFILSSCKEKLYTITFDTQGGSPVSSITQKANEEIFEPKQPTKDGYVFIGWFLDEDSEERYTFTVMPAKNITLYARWAEEYYTAGLQFSLQEDDTYQVTGYGGDEKRVIIPGYYQGKEVTSIKQFAFNNNRIVKSIIIGKNVITIKEGAFQFCDNLQSIYFPKVITSFNPNILYGTKDYIVYYEANNKLSIFQELDCLYVHLNISDVFFSDEFEYIIQNNKLMITNYLDNKAHLTIPNQINDLDVSIIGPYVFYNQVNLITIILPNNLKEIREGAFFLAKNLRKLVIPISVEKIEKKVFHYCDSLTIYTKLQDRPMGWIENFNMEGHLPVFYNVDQIYRDQNFEYIIIDNKVIITNYYGSSEKLTIPDTINNLSVGEIAGYAFARCSSLKEVIISNEVTKIGQAAFSYCDNLEKVKLPQNLTLIEERTFVFCENLQSITLPNTLVNIGKFAFFNCNTLAEIFIPKSVLTIGEYAFDACSSLTIYVEEEEVPKGWAESWNKLNRPVHWGVIDQN